MEVSGSRSHNSQHQLSSLDPNPLNTDHHHLSYTASWIQLNTNI